MPKVTITNKKGLVQSSGQGLFVNSNAQLFGGLVLGVENITAAGAASITTTISLITSDGDTMAVTLADGVTTGQVKHFISMHATNASSITPTTTDGAYANFTLTNIGETCSFIWTGTGWACIGRNTGATAGATAVAGMPVVA
jgi:hypothetical protein